MVAMNAQRGFCLFVPIQLALLQGAFHLAVPPYQGCCHSVARLPASEAELLDNFPYGHGPPPAPSELFRLSNIAEGPQKTRLLHRQICSVAKRRHLVGRIAWLQSYPVLGFSLEAAATGRHCGSNQRVPRPPAGRFDHNASAWRIRAHVVRQRE